MKIALELQPLMSVMTGVQVSALEIIKRIEAYPQTDFELEGLYFNFLRRYNDKKIRENFSFPRKSQVLLPRKVLFRLGRFSPLDYNQVFSTDADVFHFFNSIVPPRIKGKVILTVHDLLYCQFPESVDKKYLQVVKREQKRSLERANRIIAVSEFTRNEIIKFFGIEEEKISVVYNGVCGEQLAKPTSKELSEKVREKFQLPENYFLHVGTLQPRKNLEMLVEAFYEFSRENKDLHLVLAGTRWHKFEPIIKKIKDLDLEGRVKITGYITEEEKTAFYQLAECFVFPSLYEGFGIPPLEAMAAGTPVIAARSSAIPEIVGDAAHLFDPHNPRELALALNEVIQNRDFREKLIARGQKRFRKFTWEKAAQEVLEIYKYI